MSGNMRKRLGPVRNRLRDRIDEAAILLQDGEHSKLKYVRSKLLANICSHGELLGKFEELADLDDEEQTAVNQLLDEDTKVRMDAKEMLQLLDDVMNETDVKRLEASSSIAPTVDKLMQEKLEREVENLKVESEYRRAQIEALKNSVNGKKGMVKLPRIDLPEFSGKTTDWPSFWDSFRSTIHDNVSLSKVDKFKYLISCLHGEAKDTLTGFNIGDAQYDPAVNLLEERYDDK